MVDVIAQYIYYLFWFVLLLSLFDIVVLLSAVQTKFQAQNRYRKQSSKRSPKLSSYKKVSKQWGSVLPHRHKSWVLISLDSFDPQLNSPWEGPGAGFFSCWLDVCFVNVCVQGNSTEHENTPILILTNILATTASVVSLDDSSAQIIGLYASVITSLCHIFKIFFCQM